MDFVNGNKAVNEAMEYVQEKTGVPRTVQFYFLIILTGLWLTFGYGAALLSNLIAIFYPAYESIRAIESPNKEDDTKWLTYWTVFGFFACFDVFVANVLGGLPFYYLLKCIFLIWCFLPMEYNGSYVLYHQVVLGLFKQHHEEIDAGIKAIGRVLGSMAGVMVEAGRDATVKITETGRATAAKMADAGQGAMSKVSDKCRQVAENVKEKSMRGDYGRAS